MGLLESCYCVCGEWKELVLQKSWIKLPCCSTHTHKWIMQQISTPVCTQKHTISGSSFTSCRDHKTWFCHPVSPPLVFQALPTHTVTYHLQRSCGPTFNAPNYLGSRSSGCCITSGLADCIFSLDMLLALSPSLSVSLSLSLWIELPPCCWNNPMDAYPSCPCPIVTHRTTAEHMSKLKEKTASIKILAVESNKGNRGAGTSLSCDVYSCLSAGCTVVMQRRFYRSRSVVEEDLSAKC